MLCSEEQTIAQHEPPGELVSHLNYRVPSVLETVIEDSHLHPAATVLADEDGSGQENAGILLYRR